MSSPFQSIKNPCAVVIISHRFCPFVLWDFHLVYFNNHALTSSFLISPYTLDYICFGIYSVDPDLQEIEAR